jgi:hypothetical protein
MLGRSALGQIGQRSVRGKPLLSKRTLRNYFAILKWTQGFFLKKDDRGPFPLAFSENETCLKNLKVSGKHPGLKQLKTMHPSPEAMRYPLNVLSFSRKNTEAKELSSEFFH